MGAARTPDGRLTYEEYLAREEASETKHEYWQGEIFAMSGGTLEHSYLAAQLITLVNSRRGPCRAATSDTRLRVDDVDLTTYPDVTVICGPARRSPVDRNAAINPTLLAEVLSPSTEDYDQGTKFQLYRRLPTLRHYLVVAQGRPSILHFRRNDDDSWTMTEHTAGSTIPLPELGFDLAVDDVYEGVEAFREPEPPPA